MLIDEIEGIRQDFCSRNDIAYLARGITHPDFSPLGAWGSATIHRPCCVCNLEFLG